MNKRQSDTFYTKIPADQLSRSIIQSYQDACKENGYKKVAFYWAGGYRKIPYLTIGVDEKGKIVSETQRKVEYETN